MITTISEWRMYVESNGLRVMYHVSNYLNRVSIHRDGLNASGVTPWPGDDYPKGTYLWSTLAEARRYGFGNGDPFDVWAVDVSGHTVLQDPVTRAGVYVAEPIPPSDVRLEESHLSDVTNPLRESMDSGKIRVSCSALARIKIDDRYLFLLNKNSVSVGKPKYSPVGGALEFDESGRKFLEGIGAELENGRDLRFVIDRDKLDEFLEWFEKGDGRESSVLRELEEELVDENGIIDRDEIYLVDELYSGAVTELRESERAGAAVKLTHTVSEIYDVSLNDGALASLLTEAAKPDSKVVLVAASKVASDPRLAPNCKNVLG